MYSGSEVFESLWFCAEEILKELLLTATLSLFYVSKPLNFPSCRSISNIQKVYQEKDNVVEALRGDTSQFFHLKSLALHHYSDSKRKS